MDFNILVDSCCTLEKEFFKENKFIHMIGMPISIGNLDFEDHYEEKPLTGEDFFEKLKDGEISKTSLINSVSFTKYFEELSDKPTYYIAFSSKMSGTINNAYIARDMLEDSKKKNIFIIDSISASVAYGALIYRLVETLKENKDINILEFIEEYKNKINAIFTVDDLIHLKRGGRIPTALATIGTMINLKPIMKLGVDGSLEQFKKVRGRKKAIKEMIEYFKLKYNGDYSQVFIAHGNCIERAKELEKEILNIYPNIKTHIILEGATIGTHVGPGLMVLSFFGDFR